jgi:hypothetical protein
LSEDYSATPEAHAVEDIRRIAIGVPGIGNPAELAADLADLVSSEVSAEALATRWIRDAPTD